MTSVKPRPPDGPGSNGLRGGIKKYHPKTITGQWLEEFGGPSGYRRGFTTRDYESEAQHAQYGGTLKYPPEFGPELPDENDIPLPSSPFEYVQSPRKGNSSPESPWMTNNALMNSTVLNRNKDEEEQTVLKSHLPKEVLENYRKTWTADPEFARSSRFITETRLAGSATGTKFAVQSVRTLPGTPKPLELLRSMLVEKYGILAFPVVRSVFGTSELMPVKTFRKLLKDIGMDLKLYEVNQVLSVCILKVFIAIF